MTLNTVTVIELTSLFMSFVKRSETPNSSSVEALSELYDLENVISSDLIDEQLQSRELAVFRAKTNSAWSIVDRLLKDGDKDLPNHYFYGTDISLDKNLWKPLCSSENHSLRTVNFVSSITLETDWKHPLLRCGKHRYRFYVANQDSEFRLDLLHTDSPQMAQRFIDRIEHSYPSEDFDSIRILISLFYPITEVVKDKDNGSIRLQTSKNSLVIKIGSELVELIGCGNYFDIPLANCKRDYSQIHNIIRAVIETDNI
tara:strand:- start:36235 stop:37005 length:771 start_codon:yes stop_codon:yes gene_type:complete